MTENPQNKSITVTFLASEFGKVPHALSSEDFFRYPAELVDEVLAEANEEGSNLQVDIDWAIRELLHKELDNRMEQAEIAAAEAKEAAEIAARTPKQWAAEVTRLEQRLNDYKAECPNDECFQQASFEREIAETQAAAKAAM